MRIIITTIFCLCICAILSAQNVDKMNETERTETLLRVAKEGILEYGPDYYREYGKPEIKHGYVTKDNKYFSDEDYKKHSNRSYYTVKYGYNENEESFYQDYSAHVFIWGDTGKIFSISFGNGFGLGPDLDQPRTRSNSNSIRQMTWEKQPPGKFKLDNAIKE